MLKRPRAGAVKTRLGRDIGMVQAAWWFRHQTRQLIRRLSHDRRWQSVLSVAPDRSLFAPIWPRGVLLMPQGGGDLGQRMARAFQALPPGPAVLIGGDIPGVSRPHIARAFSVLGHKDAVFGPAEDGGFWLVGFRRNRPLPQGVFRGVRWSGPNALQDALGTVAGCQVGIIDRLRDIDRVEDMV